MGLIRGRSLQTEKKRIMRSHKAKHARCFMSGSSVAKKLIGILVCVGVFAGAQYSTPARATIVTLDFSGTINSVSDGAGTLTGTGIAAGTSTFSGSFSYDTGAGVIGSQPNATGYTGGLFSVTIDGTYVLSDDPSVITITDDFGTLNRDGFFIGSSGAANQYDLPVNNSYQFFINLFDSSATAFNSTALPASLSLAQFDTATFSVVEVSGGYDVDGVIQSLTVRKVPEPETVLIFAVGLLAIPFLRRRPRTVDARR